MQANVYYSKATQVRGGKFVFVKDGSSNTLKTVTNGGKLLNPFKKAGTFALPGDLVEYRIDGTCLLLKTFKVADAVTAADTVIKIKADGYSHIPEAGNILMKAPTTATGTGAAGTISKVVKNGDMWELTITANALGTLAADDILVEAVEAGTGKTVLVKNPNSFIVKEEIFELPTDDSDEMYSNVSYMLTTQYGLTAYIQRMSPIPAYVLNKNRSYIDGLFSL